jgi:hypothetical protein
MFWVCQNESFDNFQELVDQFRAREKIEPAHVSFEIRDIRLR